jgi:hypothetical protein
MRCTVLQSLQKVGREDGSFLFLSLEFSAYVHKETFVLLKCERKAVPGDLPSG